METLSTGCSQLDALIEALWPGDNVVFVGGTAQDYEALVRPAVAYAQNAGLPTLRLAPDLTADEDHRDLALPVATPAAIWDAARGCLAPGALETIEPQAYVVADELSELIADEQQAVAFFTSVCPDLYRRRAVAYWHLAEGRFSPHALAAIRDCTQIFIRLENTGDETIITPLKVQGRYADDMFRPHRLVFEPEVGICPLRMDPLALGEYTQTLEAKNRELTAIRDALNRANARLEEQSRLYDSLSANLEHLVELLEAGRHIGASLRLEQVQQAVVRTALALFPADFCRLTIEGVGDPQVVELGAPEAEHDAGLEMRCSEVSVSLRSPRRGKLQVWMHASPLGDEQAHRLLGYLASEAGIALDNAVLYRETEAQKEQLRTFVNEVIANEERDSRQLALDLHDGLVQQIVAAYQHLQTAQVWRGRDPNVEERELERGIRIVKQSIVEARRLISQLRPAGLDDFGLARAVRLLANQQAAANEWGVELQVDPYWPPLPSTVEAALFRIIQEATNNARKYARSKKLLIALQVGEQHLDVLVRDWGRGFDPNAVLSRPEQGLRLGLVGIRERTNLLGGSCEIISAPGEGATVVIHIPRELARREEA
jgi:signal transduction histidine kinase